MIFLERLRSAFNKYPDKNAFCIQDRYYTYGDLILKIDSIRALIGVDSAYGQNIGIVVSDDLETYASILAVLLSGLTYVPIHPGHPLQRTEQIVQQSGLRLTLSKTDFVYKSITTINTSSHSESPEATEIRTPVVDQQRTNAYILFTSGSTGVPKGVPISYYNVDSFINAFFGLGYRADENDRFLQMFDLTFDLSVMSYLVPLCLGACVYTVPDTGMKYANVYKVLETHNITFALMVPSLLTYLRPYFSEIELPDLKYSLFCGEALYKDTLAEWMTCVPNAVVENVYGPTEATIFCLTYNIKDKQSILAYNEIVSIGKAMKGMEAIVVDEHHQIVTDGVRGELCLNGDQVTSGYIDPEKDRKAFIQLDGKKYYRTGDIAYRDDNGNFMYCGRADQQVKIQGYRIELSEVEFHLRKISGHGNVVAISITAPGGLARIDAVFEGGSIGTELVMTELKTKLPGYMIPSQVHFIDAFPLNANGKTDRKALEKMIADRL